ncbi:hypothetical protein [Paenibacillus ferrarius]|uniref:hypothetical protein n=1 Tax=Paenibacillus ferrarius TaxID=1469647 RepID=UPI003D297A03
MMMESAGSARSAGHEAELLRHVANVAELLELQPDGDGQLVYVDGYARCGDGGGKLVRWQADSSKADNGGTVHAASRESVGRWETVHQGVGDFRWFGVLGPERDADDALEALVNDPAIHRVEARTDLNFARRHRFHRSGIELDFGGRTVTTEGIERNTKDNPFGAVLFFQGQAAGETQSVVLTEELPEHTDVLEVADAGAFAVEEWWIARIGNRPEGGAQRELDYLLQVTEIVDARHVRVNYKLGWPLAAGREIAYKKMRPVFRSHVRNMRFVGVTVPDNGSTTVRPTEDWDGIGSHPIAYEFAVSCDVSDVEATKVFWPVVERRYCTHYVTERCRLTNPEEVIWGGTGYLTQQLNVLYAHVRDCNTSNARHLNDFTCAAYAMVENCHGDGDEHGTFVTHGQFEHDLTFVGNSGLLSFANSGTTWGNSAKRITVKKHVASRVVAHKCITDLTLEDVHAIWQEGLVDAGTIWANTDGLHMRGCTAETMLTLSQSSARSKRANVLDGCAFVMQPGAELARLPGSALPGFGPVTSDVTVQNCKITGLDGNVIGSIRSLVFINTWLYGSSPAARPLQAGCTEVRLLGGGLVDSGIALSDFREGGSPAAEQTLVVDGGAVLRGTNAEKALLQGGGAGRLVAWRIGACTSEAAGADTAHFRLRAGRHRMRVVGAGFAGGRFDVEPGALERGSYLFITSCVEEGVDRSAVPAECETVQHTAGNLLLD